MVHTIEKLKNRLEFQDGNSGFSSMTGYAFIDECGKTIIITYGEKNRDFMSEYLNGKSDPLKLKYKYI